MSIAAKCTCKKYLAFCDGKCLAEEVNLDALKKVSQPSLNEGKEDDIAKIILELDKLPKEANYFGTVDKIKYLVTRLTKHP